MTMPMIHRADVYTQGAGGAFTVLDQGGLPCRVINPSLNSRVMDLPARAENARARTLVWDVSYVMPDYAQLEIEGERWNPLPETIQKIEALTGGVVERRALIVRAG